MNKSAMIIKNLSQINTIAGSVAIAGNASVDVTGSQRNIEIRVYTLKYDIYILILIFEKPLF